MCKVIAIVNQKGGVGKTTTAINIGNTIAEADKRVLEIDLDPQGSLTVSMGYDDNDNYKSNIDGHGHRGREEYIISIGCI
jgi:chromosome partitioning protein